MRTLANGNGAANMARQDVMKIGPEDRASQEDALKVFKNLFPGAAQLFVRAVYSVGKTDVSLGPALGSGACRSPFAHSDPAVLAAIAAIEDPDVRRYAEQRCTEAALQRLLRENPAHAYFSDRLRELYDESIEGRLAMEIGKLQEYVRAINDIQDGVIGQLHARVRALEEQLQQPVVQAEHV